METSAKSGVFKYEHSWSIPQTLENLATALAQGWDVSISTSGSTGAPKEILIPASAMIFSARNSNLFLGAKPGDRWSLLLSPEHTAGINVLVRSIELGTAPVSETESADFTAIVPTQLFRALNGDEQLLKHLQGCKAVLVGGAHADENLLVQAKNLGINCITTYGMTETSGGCVYNGEPLPGVEIRIGETIEIKGPMLAKVPLTDGFFATSDLGKVENGKLIILGRADDVINSGGKKVSLSKVEYALGEQFAAFGSENSEWGSALNIATTSQTSDEEIQLILSVKFGVKALNIFRIKEIPRTALEKIDRQALGKLISS
ncbi:MAG: AMP-binding protein [Candidatus Nanopelagicaceae bacterium]|jgi:O-succinylbenzoic acid--CoA ligase|nr:AMP-binding protein [Candidatus Nanopelagicaceae bacterium]